MELIKILTSTLQFKVVLATSVVIIALCMLALFDKDCKEIRDKLILIIACVATIPFLYTLGIVLSIL